MPQIVADQPTTNPAASETGSENRVPALLWILAAGLVVRLVLWMFWKDLPIRIVDAQDYNQLALSILNDGRFASPSGELTSIRPPLYPAFLAGTYAVFGAENYAAVRLIQSLIGLATAGFIYLLGKEVFTPRIGLWGAAACAFYPSFLGFNNLLVSETLFTLFVTAVTFLVVAAVKRQSFRLLPFIGILLGFGALTRSILWLFAPLLALFLLWAWRQRASVRIAAAATCFGCFLLTIAPWAYRNTKLEQTLTIVDCMGGRNAMMGNYEYTPLERSWATIDIARGEQAWHRVLAAKYPERAGMTQGQLDKLAMRHGIAFAFQHPLLTAKRDVVRFFNFWQLERTLVAGAATGFFGKLPKPVIATAGLLICGSYAVAIFAGLFGILLMPPEDRRLHWFLVISVVFPCIIHTLIFAHSRYHLPIMPVILLYAVAALLHWRVIWTRRSEWTFKLAVAGCLLLTMGWLREIVMVDLAKTSGMIG